MDSNKTLPTEGNLYSVDFGSELGQKLNTYFDKSAEANLAAIKFVEKLLSPYMETIKSLTIEGQPPYVFDFPDDCEAGGVLTISLPRKDGKVTDDEDPKEVISPEEYILPYMLYDAIPDPLFADSRVCYFPRMQRRSRFIRFGQAVKLAAEGNPCWKFDVADKKHRGKSGIRCYHYGDRDVRVLISTADKQAICDRKGHSPSDAVRLAHGIEYFLPFSGHDGEDITDQVLSLLPDATDILRQAKDAYTEWMNLPCVYSGRLMDLLSLNISATFPNGVKRKSEVLGVSYCYHFIDSENKRYMIYTGLKSINEDMKMLSDPSDLEYFKQSIIK